MAEVIAPAAWHCIDIISDVHLQESESANFLAWQHHLENSPADALFILGDLFELWVGDDVLATHHEALHFEGRCIHALHACAQHFPVYVMHGNRDFLLGEQFLKASGAQALADPSVLDFAGERILLTHGDALCLSDTAYIAFRAQVRSNRWQSAFLAQPLPERLQAARDIRHQSDAGKQARQQAGQPWVDIDADESVRWLNAAHARHLIHGHTHEGQSHTIFGAQGAGQRHVLSDWHVGQAPARGDVLRLTRCSAREQALHVQRLPITAV